MGKRKTIRTQIGLTQEEMAIVLNISRAQWSMYESNRRSLPSAAFILYSKMDIHLQSTAAIASKNQILDSVQLSVTKEVYDKLRLENEYQLQKALLKLDVFTAENEAYAKAIQLESFVTELKFKHSQEMLKSIVSRAQAGSKKNTWVDLFALQSRVQQFQLEKEVLHAEFKKWMPHTKD